MTNAIPAPPLLLMTVSTGPLKVSTADDGPMSSMISSIELVVSGCWPTSAVIETSAMSAGKSDRIE